MGKPRQTAVTYQSTTCSSVGHLLNLWNCDIQKPHSLSSVLLFLLHNSVRVLVPFIRKLWSGWGCQAAAGTYLFSPGAAFYLIHQNSSDSVLFSVPVHIRISQPSSSCHLPTHQPQKTKLHFLWSWIFKIFGANKLHFQDCICKKRGDWSSKRPEYLAWSHPIW